MDGDAEFASFMRDSSHRLYRVAYLLTGDRGRAEELTQDALARTYAAWRRVRWDDAYAYTRRVMVNLHNDWWRARPWREQLVAQVPDGAGTADPATVTVHRNAVARALQALTRRERTVIVYRYFLDLTEQQTARELGLAVGTVKSATARALAKLRISPDLDRNGPAGLVVAEGAS
jgi:RNA polymerase sigma-70 factor (sigma-E family)